MIIRQAIDADKPKVLDFCKNTFSWGDYIGDVWDIWKSNEHLYVLEEEGKVVGTYNLSPTNQVWIEGMRVHPDYRRRGFGKYMLSHAESIHHLKLFRLIIDSENHPSLRLAESMGYHLEDKWQLYSTTPKKEKSQTKHATSLSEVNDKITSATYADSWKWYPLDEEEILKLIKDGRILISSANSNREAIGIWNRSKDFPNVLQLGYINGSSDGILDILLNVRNKVYDLGCERIQIFAQEKILLRAEFLDKKSLFYLMRKDLSKKNL